MYPFMHPAIMNCKLYLFRHGQTHYNKKKRFTGWFDAIWTSTGCRNARKNSRRLRHKRIDVAFCTHLRRSKHTLNHVLYHHSECSFVFVDDRIIERCYGTLQGHSHQAFIRKYGKELFDKYHRAYDFPPPHGESVKMVEGRVKSFIKDLLAFIKKYKVNVAISAHGNSMRAFRRHFENASVKQMMQWEMPYDTYFEYLVEVPAGPAPKIAKNSWKPVRLPQHITLATDRHNPFKKYY